MRALLLVGALSLLGTLRAQDINYSPSLKATKNRVDYKCENCDPNEQLTTNKEVLSVSVYPNPCLDKCNIKITGVSKNEEAIITIMDLMGKCLFTYLATDGEVELQLTKTGLELNEGTYLVQLKLNDQIDTKRMVVK